MNNAGIIINKLMVDMTLEDCGRIFAVNIRGVFLHSREAMRAMIPNGTGAIVDAGYWQWKQSVVGSGQCSGLRGYRDQYSQPY